ncbi:hypothetical protein AB0I84_07475 [Streptomyces spectabilis]|uniref:hypothetical protein n=1 Tax=Streptomyces spectabilis TaxID=68270 RepID=UPI00340DE6DB
MVWNGTKWVEGSKKVWDGKAWSTKASVQFFDGQQWQVKAPQPTAFPRFISASTTRRTTPRHVTVAVPAEAKVTDFIVSVCVADAPSQLLAPAAFLPQVHRLPSGTTLTVVVWPYDGRPGDVVWQTQGATNATAMNLVYRGGDVSTAPIAPVKEIANHAQVNRVPLTSPVEYTSLLLVVAEATDLTGCAWPDGVLERARSLGPFGTPAASLLAADTPGAGASPGQLILDTTVRTAACATIQIPGINDGQPTWILSDDVASVLGSTTRLG